VNTEGNPAELRVAAHYAVENIEERILSAFEASAKPRDSITLADLSAVDEFHIGGREATESIAAQMKLHAGMHLLDIGCGIGGPARYFASARRCKVTGIDLTPEYVRTAQALSELVGLRDSVRFEHGSAMQLPFQPGSFDGAYMFHVGMNLSHKAQFFREVKRILQPGSVFAIYDVMRTGPGELEFPVPWAGSEHDSFLATTDEYRRDLSSAGFVILAERQRKEFAIEFLERIRQRTQQEGPKSLGIHLIMGESAMTKTGNVLDGLRRGVIAPVEIVARS
jgi:ubiquinone/menaquinone biosynthesis C-methylase UbiE